MSDGNQVNKGVIGAIVSGVYRPAMDDAPRADQKMTFAEWEATRAASYIKDCYFRTRPEDGPLFSGGGAVSVNLNGMVVMPLDQLLDPDALAEVQERVRKMIHSGNT